MSPVSILCYHSINSSWQSNLAVAPAVFEQHCRWLARHRSVVDLEMAVARMRPSGSLPSNLTALTFDDGFADFYEHALPIVLRYRLPCTVFLVAETLRRQEPVADWVDDSQSCPQRTLSLDQ